MLMINNQTAVLFDLDDTLYCEHDYVRSGFKAVADRLHLIYSGLNSDELYMEMIHLWEKEGRGKIFNRIVEMYDLPIEPTELVKVYREHQPVLRLYEDAKRLIEILVKMNIPRGIITDGIQVVQRAKIKALGLESRFHCVIVTDEWGKECWKPSPIPYKKAMEFFKYQAERFVYIGDNPHKDFISAKKMGFLTIRIVRETGDFMGVKLSPEYEADIIIHNLDELFPFIING
jgi:putative hydrolase of the HAD superfamily